MMERAETNKEAYPVCGAGGADGGYRKFENTLAAIYSGQVKQLMFQAKETVLKAIAPLGNGMWAL